MGSEWLCSSDIRNEIRILMKPDQREMKLNWNSFSCSWAPVILNDLASLLHNIKHCHEDITMNMTDNPKNDHVNWENCDGICDTITVLFYMFFFVLGRSDIALKRWWGGRLLVIGDLLLAFPIYFNENYTSRSFL